METSERVGESAIQLVRPCRMQLVRSVGVSSWDSRVRKDLIVVLRACFTSSFVHRRM
jgi:hypothetical protein